MRTGSGGPSETAGHLCILSLKSLDGHRQIPPENGGRPEGCPLLVCPVLPLFELQEMISHCSSDSNIHRAHDPFENGENIPAQKWVPVAVSTKNQTSSLQYTLP